MRYLVLVSEDPDESNSSPWATLQKNVVILNLNCKNTVKGGWGIIQFEFRIVLVLIPEQTIKVSAKEKFWEVKVPFSLPSVTTQCSTETVLPKGNQVSGQGP